MTSKKAAMALALASASTVALAGCGSSTSPSANGGSSKVSISYLTLWPSPQVAIFQKAIKNMKSFTPTFLSPFARFPLAISSALSPRTL